MVFHRWDDFISRSATMSPQRRRRVYQMFAVYTDTISAFIAKLKGWKSFTVIRNLEELGRRSWSQWRQDSFTIINWTILQVFITRYVLTYNMWITDKTMIPYSSSIFVSIFKGPDFGIYHLHWKIIKIGQLYKKLRVV